MVALYRDPQGDNIFDRADAATMSTIHSNNKILNMSDDSLDKDKTIENLRRRIRVRVRVRVFYHRTKHLRIDCFNYSFKQSVISLAVIIISVSVYCNILCFTLLKWRTYHWTTA